MLRRHVLESCLGARDARDSLGITAFFGACRALGRSKAAAMELFVNGRDETGAYVGRAAHLARGADLRGLQELWLGSWEQAQ